MSPSAAALDRLRSTFNGELVGPDGAPARKSYDDSCPKCGKGRDRRVKAGGAFGGKVVIAGASLGKRPGLMHPAIARLRTPVMEGLKLAADLDDL